MHDAPKVPNCPFTQATASLFSKSVSLCFVSSFVKCPLTEERMKKWYVSTMEYYLSIKKNEIMPFAATWMDLEIVMSEISQTEKRQISHDSTYMCNLKI